MAEDVAASGPVAVGVAFPADAAGRRSTSALGRSVAADALRATDPVGALGAEQETNWRSGYLTHFRRLIEAGAASREAALSIAGHGLGSLHERMRVVRPDGSESPIGELLTAPAGRSFGSVAVAGSGEPEAELALPYQGERLRGDALLRRLDAWVAAGIVEPSCAEAVRTVAGNPEWLSLPGRTVAVLGAGSEIGPLPVLLRWGATVAGIDLPRQQLWDRVLESARAGAGTLVMPVREPAAGAAAAAGADITSEVPEIAAWLGGLDGPLVLGNYVYADGAANVRVCMAADALTMRLQAERDELALAFLATPTDVFVVPADAVAQSVRAYEARPRMAKVAGRPLRMVSGGRLLRRAYLPGADPGINDSLVAQQGPNYALAKRLQRWRAAVAREAGTTVSLNVAPPTRTRSVLKNRGLAAAYAGAHRFGVEAFEPDTCRVLMAALLVYDLNAGGGPDTGSGVAAASDPNPAPPWQHEAHAAAHGGLWRGAYAPRSALGLAALLGYGASRS
jgi:hypothetical protein